MGKIETWELLDRTDERISFLFSRRIVDTEEALTLEMSEKQREQKELEKETRSVVESLSSLNIKIRNKYKIEKKKEKKKKNYSNSMENEEKKKEPCDHRGIPLSHPMAMTPYPGKSTAAQREKARKMLAELAIKMHEEEMKKKMESENASSTSEASKKTTKSSPTSIPIRKTASAVSDKTMGCDKCGSCQKCVERCSRKHAATRRVTEAEREKFLEDIRKLRERIRRPEKSREYAARSPYDVTQSDSDVHVNENRSGKKKKKQKKSKRNI